jgi:hypothetical protein
MRVALSLASATIVVALMPHAAAAANENCRAVADATQRLACYDAREDQKGKRGEEKIARQKASFGLTEKQKEPEDRNEVEAVSGQIERVSGTRIYLADGAVWAFARDSRIINWIRPGQAVTIKKGLVGGYRATVDGVNGREAVTRVR